ncbi:hypothetical protein FRC03_000814, partial [Tulasnella sp. 419]
MSSNSLPKRSWDVFQRTWDLGFTAFGGPPTHFQILHKRFVERHEWIDEQTYQEVFALSQSLPGPASTKMLYTVSFLRGGFIPSCMAFALWSFPGAAGMFGLALGVSSIGDTLPNQVYALLSGLNSATVGIIAVAAVQLSERAITDPFTRAVLAASAGAGMLYKALWYFPVLMVISGLATVWWDILGGRNFTRKLNRGFGNWKERILRPVNDRVARHQRETHSQDPEGSREGPIVEIPLRDIPSLPPALISPDRASGLVSRNVANSNASTALKTPPQTPPPVIQSIPVEPPPVQHRSLHTVPVPTGA